tara:strand:+ start:146591 stop:147685 length:1095 start_codon:yes stop_codon:yes gene_type:complete
MFKNKNINQLRPYIVTSHEAWEHKEDQDILKLDWNEATELPSPNVRLRLKAVIENGRLNWYPDTNNTQLLKKISDYNQVNITNVQYFASSDALHEYIVRCFISDSDRVLIIGPTYDNFRAVAESNGAHVQYYDLDNIFSIDYVQFNKDLKLIKPKVVYIVNPNNPTGTLHPKTEIEKLLIDNPEVFFIIDEAYYEFSKISLASVTDKYDNILISRTFSKAFALASFRIGYTISNKKNIQILNTIRNAKNVSLFAQEAAIAVLEDLAYVENYVKEVLEAKEFFIRSLKDFSWIEMICNGSGNFVFFSIKNIELKKKLLDYLKQNKVFIRDYGHVETTAKFVRITVGRISDMKRVIELFESFGNDR